MAVKTITIDMEAYNLLAKEKQKDESFSKVIKRTIKEKRKTAGILLSHIQSIAPSEETLDNIDLVVDSRQESIISSPVIGGDEE